MGSSEEFFSGTHVTPIAVVQINRTMKGCACQLAQNMGRVPKKWQKSGLLPTSGIQFRQHRDQVRPTEALIHMPVPKVASKKCPPIYTLFTLYLQPLRYAIPVCR